MAKITGWLTLLVINLVCLSIALEESNSNQDNRTKRKRSFYPWGNRAVTPQYESIAKWKTPTYQLGRPYYIPIYGAPGRIPMYYPPQPFLLNPGSPQDNTAFPRQHIYLHPFNNNNNQGSKKDFKGPPYLPPEKKPTMPDNRFGEDDDLPIWGGNSVETDKVTTPRPAAIRPTRLPKPKVEPTLPPLSHKDGSSSSSGTNQLAVDEPSLSPGAGIRQEPQAGPSNCVWAIVNCCSVKTGRFVDSCFEQRGCPGPFWGKSPCEGDFARAALESALGYYNP
ncbi:unnamed protein product [Brassicogethes aeneus]|uniref:Uncharacterized protein n=1 Tax=Brassicogethes aeneus TaxID=1431903 RepID=A0A9P0FE84_BRAAE|nr:unnamed protein product [Brassicogethes aeneus]